jgi:hypothetical protein
VLVGNVHWNRDTHQLKAIKRMGWSTKLLQNNSWQFFVHFLLLPEISMSGLEKSVLNNMWQEPQTNRGKKKSYGQFLGKKRFHNNQPRPFTEANHSSVKCLRNLYRLKWLRPCVVFSHCNNLQEKLLGDLQQKSSQHRLWSVPLQLP